MNWWETVDWQDPINRDCPLNAGILGWWMGAPGLFGGTRLWDLCNKSHGTLTNMDPVTAWQTSPYGPTFATEGTTKYVAVPRTFNLPTATWVIGFKIATPPAGGRHLLCGMMNGFNSSAYDKQLRLSSDGGGTMEMYAYDGAQQTISGVAVSAGEQHIAIASWDGVRARLHLDGILVGDISCGATYAGYTVNNAFIGGSYDSVTSGSAVTNINQVLLMDRGLSAAQAVAMTYQVRTGFPDMLNHYRELIYSPLDSSTSINKELQLLWDSLQLAVNDIQIDYNTSLLSSQNNMFLWNNKSKTFSEQTLSYHILSRVSKDFGIPYNVLQLIIQDISYLFNTLGAVQGPIQISWNDLALATQTKDTSYNILSKINNEIETIAHARGLTPSETQTLWNVLLNLAVNKDFTWNTLHLSQNSVEMLYNIRTLVEKSIQSLFKTRHLSSMEVDYIWDVIGPRSTAIVFEMLMYIKQGDIRNFTIKKQALHDLILGETSGNSQR